MGTARPLLALLLAAPLLGDVIYLKDGERLEGKVVSEAEKEIKVAVQKKGMTLTVTVPRADIERIDSSNEVDAHRTEFKKRRDEVLALPQGSERVERLYDLGVWARGAGLRDESIQAFNDMRDTLPDLDDMADLEIARTHLVSGDHQACQDDLEKLLKRNPNHEHAKALAKELVEDVTDEVTEDSEKGFEYYNKGNCRRALAIFENFVNKRPRSEVDLVSKKCQEKTGHTLLEVMIDCRIRQGCPAGCMGGWKPCPRPTCQKGRSLHFEKPVEGSGRSPTSVQYCGTCKGLHYLICERCGGTGIYFGKPTAYEKEEFVKVVSERAARMSDTALGIAKQAAETEAQQQAQEPADRPADALADRTRLGQGIAPGAVDPMTVLSKARRARTFFMDAMKISSEQVIAQVHDLHERLVALDDLSFGTAREASRKYQEKAEVLYQQAVGAEGGMPVDITGLQTRIDRAAEAAGLAEQARMYLYYALKDCDPSSPHRLDAQRQLESATRTAERCHKAHEALLAAQQRLEDLRDNPDRQRAYQRELSEIWGELQRKLK